MTTNSPRRRGITPLPPPLPPLSLSPSLLLPSPPPPPSPPFLLLPPPLPPSHPLSSLLRRTLLAAGAALPLCGIITRRASAAEFSYKLATGQDPTHPINIRAQEAIDRIREATGGQLDIRLFPANQLGSDTDLLSQVRMGAVEFFNLSSSVVATLVPQASIVNTGFAFPDYDAVWRAMDGDLGTYVRAQIAKRGIMTASRVWDNGFRHVTSSTRAIHTPGPARVEDPRPTGGHVDFRVQGAQCRTVADQLQRTLLGAPDQGGGGPGKPARDHRDGPAL